MSFASRPKEISDALQTQEMGQIVESNLKLLRELNLHVRAFCSNLALNGADFLRHADQVVDSAMINPMSDNMELYHCLIGLMLELSSQNQQYTQNFEEVKYLNNYFGSYFTNLRQIGEGGYGIAFTANLHVPAALSLSSDVLKNDAIVIKVPRSGFDPLHESVVGTVLNALRQYNFGFTYCLGGFYCESAYTRNARGEPFQYTLPVGFTPVFDQGLQMPLQVSSGLGMFRDSKATNLMQLTRTIASPINVPGNIFSLCDNPSGDYEHAYSFSIWEYVSAAKIYEYIKIGNLNDFRNIWYLTLHTLMFAQKYCYFMHNDLHVGNYLVRKFPQPVSVKTYQQRPCFSGQYFEEITTLVHPVILDFGRATVNIGNREVCAFDFTVPTLSNKHCGEFVPLRDIMYLTFSILINLRIKIVLEINFDWIFDSVKDILIAYFTQVLNPNWQPVLNDLCERIKDGTYGFLELFHDTYSSKVNRAVTVRFNNMLSTLGQSGNMEDYVNWFWKNVL
jgi:hypothetical protein